MSQGITSFDELVNNFKINNYTDETKFIIIFTTNDHVELNELVKLYMSYVDLHNEENIQLALINIDQETDLNNRKIIEKLNVQLNELPVMMTFNNLQSNTYKMISLGELNNSVTDHIVVSEFSRGISNNTSSEKKGGIFRRIGKNFGSIIGANTKFALSKKLVPDDKLNELIEEVGENIGENEANKRLVPVAALGMISLDVESLVKDMPLVEKATKTITIPEGNGNIEDLLLTLLKEHHEFREEVRMNFQKVHDKLEQIHNNLQQEKMYFIESVNTLINLPETNMRNQELENTHNEADNLLLKYTNKMLENNTKISTAITKYEFLENFEDDSKNMIRSCFFVHDLVLEQQVKEFDYSLCAVGFWKAVEIELNIILIDSIRFIRGLINGVPSNQKTLKSGRELVFGGYLGRKEYYVDINKTSNGKLISVMLGDMSRIVKNYKQNDLQSILSQIQTDNSTIINLSSFMSSFITDLNTIIYTYRNRCSHTGFLEETEYNNLEQLLFNENGLYNKIGVLKEKIYSNF